VAPAGGNYPQVPGGCQAAADDQGHLAGIGRPYACAPALGAVDGVVHAPRSPVAEAGLQKRGAATDNSDYVDTQFHS